MLPISFRGLLIRVHLDQIASCAWMAMATIEDPATAESAPVALPDVHPTPRAAVIQVVAEARARIRRGSWRN